MTMADLSALRSLGQPCTEPTKSGFDKHHKSLGADQTKGLSLSFSLKRGGSCGENQRQVSTVVMQGIVAQSHVSYATAAAEAWLSWAKYVTTGFR